MSGELTLEIVFTILTAKSEPLYQRKFTMKYPRFLLLLSAVLVAPLSLSAYTELPGQTLETDMTLAAGTYLLTGTIGVPEGVTLTLQPGVVIKANSWWRSIQVDGGVIVANAAGRAPIVFTSSHDPDYGEAIPGSGSPGPDQWAGVILSKTADTQTPAQGTFVNCIFRYGGGWSFGMLETIDAHLTVDNCRFEESKEAGIKIEGGPVLNEHQPVIRDSVFLNNRRCGIYGKQNVLPEGWRTYPRIEGCTFDGNVNYAMEFYDSVFPDFDGSNQLIQRLDVRNGIAWEGATNIDYRLEYPGPNFPYVLTGGFTVEPGAKLTVEAGVIVKADSWWNTITVVAGTMHVNGTAQMPVYFTSYQDDTIGGDTNGNGAGDSPAPDQWAGVRLLTDEPPALNPSSGEFTHTHFRYGGGWTASMLDIDGSMATLMNCSFMYSAEEGSRVTATEVQPANVSFIGCEFSENNGLGFHIRHEHEEGISEPVIQNCVFRGNGAYAGRIWGNVFPITNRSNELQLAQEVINGVAIGHAITRSGSLEPFGNDFPYILNGDLGVPYGVTLTITAGAIIKADDWWHHFHIRGDLDVEGLPGDPVTFTSLLDDSIAGDTNGDFDETEPAPAQWGGIYLLRDTGAPSAGSVTATHMRMYYGGGWTDGHIDSDGGAIDCANCVFAHSGEHGVHFRQQEDRTAPLSFVNCEFLSNDSEGLHIHHENGAIRPLLHGCHFSGNKGFAARFIGDIFPQFDGHATVAQGDASGRCGLAIEGTIESSGRLEYPGDPAPYILSNGYLVEPGAAVSVDPGVIVKADDWWHYFRARGASFTAVGTASMPIIFTSYQDDWAAGDTNGDGTESSGSPNQWGGLLAQESASVTLEYCQFRYGGGYTNGLLSVDSSNASANNCVFTHSGDYGIYASGTSVVNIRNSAISDNASYGARMSSSTHMIDARFNYWGHPSGPLDDSDADDLVEAAGYTHYHPDGQGQEVTNNVIYNGWLDAVPVWEPYLWWDAADSGGGWRQSAWYGWFNDLRYPYISHVEHGWQYCLGDSQNSIYIYDYALGCWLWVSKEWYPLIYKFQPHAGWYLYLTGGRTPNRWFYRYATGGYVNEPNLK